MLAIVDAMTDRQRKFAHDYWKPDGTRRCIEKSDELVLLSQNQCIFEDLELVLGGLGGEDDASNK